MASLTTIIESCTAKLASVTPRSLTAEMLSGSREFFEKMDINEAIDQYHQALPPKPEEEEQLAEWEQLMHAKADELNKATSALNKELARLKEMQAALPVAQLEDLIHAAQAIIRPLYNFTSGLGV